MAGGKRHPHKSSLLAALGTIVVSVFIVIKWSGATQSDEASTLTNTLLGLTFVETLGLHSMPSSLQTEQTCPSGTWCLLRWPCLFLKTYTVQIYLSSNLECSLPLVALVNLDQTLTLAVLLRL